MFGGEGRPPLDDVLTVRRGEDGVWTRVPEPPDDDRDDNVRSISSYAKTVQGESCRVCNSDEQTKIYHYHYDPSILVLWRICPLLVPIPLQPVDCISDSQEEFLPLPITAYLCTLRIYIYKYKLGTLRSVRLS